MKRIYLSLMILWLIAAGTVTNSVFSQDEEMKKNALQSMREWSKSIAPDQFQKLGYKDKAEFNKAELGEPYSVYTIDPEKLVELESGKDISRLLTKTGYMVYPVISEGRNKSLLWMYQKDNVWKIAKVGSSGISENIKVNESLIPKYREQYKFDPAAKPKLVRIYQLFLDFFLIKGEQDEYMIPMQDNPALDIRGNTVYPMKEILPVLQENLKERMPFKDDKGNIKEF